MFYPLSSGNWGVCFKRLMIFHYTSIASLDGIIREDSICLRATHYQHLNDKIEVAWCQESLRELCGELKELCDEDFQLYHITPYIISFCNTNDDFNMWRLYGNDGKGIMLCFDYHLLKTRSKEKAETSLGKVIYANNKNRKEKYEQALQTYDIETVNDHIEDMFAACSFVKTDLYQIENEERFVIIKDKNTSLIDGEIISRESKEGVKHRMRGSELVPFIEFKFPIEMLKAVVIGYGLDFEKTKTGIIQILKEHGEAYQNVLIEQSVHAK